MFQFQAFLAALSGMALAAVIIILVAACRATLKDWLQEEASSHPHREDPNAPPHR